MTKLDETMQTLKAGKSIVWQFCNCKKDLLSLFGGEKNFYWTYSNLTYVRLINPSQKIEI